MGKTSQRDLFPGALEMMVLQILRLEPMHGYALAQRIKQMSNEILKVEEGSLYPSLQRLLKQDYVQAAWTQSATNRRIRVYRITRSGIRHLEREISSFEQMLMGISLVLTPAKP
ncbi:MAG: PadR family transcriptional regulator [Bryobacteraceae bacterium]